MINLEQLNEFINVAYITSRGSAYERTKTKLLLEDISRLWLKVNGYEFDHHARTKNKRYPGNIDQMAHKDLVRLYQANNSVYERFNDSEVWRKVDSSSVEDSSVVEENHCYFFSFEGEDLPFEL